MWLAWRECGDSGWATMVENYMDLSAYLERLVEQHDELEMMSTREWTNVCFRYVPKSSVDDLSELNIEVRNRLLRNGNYMVSRSNIGEQVVIRAVIANPKITQSTLHSMVEEIVTHGREIVRGLPELN